MNQARFDYVNAMSAACGLSAPEAVGLVLCRKGAKIKETNSKYRDLCKRLNLPTLKDLAITQARRMIGQWAAYEPELFIGDSDEISDVHAPTGSLLSDLFKLSTESVNVWYPEYEEAKKKNDMSKLKAEEYPLWSQTWNLAASETKKVYGRFLQKKPMRRDIVNTYALENRRKFRVLEMLDRASKRLLIPSKAAKRNAASTDTETERPAKRKATSINLPATRRNKRKTASEDNPRAKRARTIEFNCTTGHPRRPGRPSKIPCRICGYSCDPKKQKLVTLSCCSKICHEECWRAQHIKTKQCKDIHTFLKKDKTTPNEEATTTNRITVDPTVGLSCDLCDRPLIKDKGNDGDQTGHYLRECTAIPGTPPIPTPTQRQTVRRMAALGLIKRVGKTDRVMRSRITSNHHTTPTTPSSPTPSVYVSDSHPTVVADDS